MSTLWTSRGLPTRHIGTGLKGTACLVGLSSEKDIIQGCYRCAKKPAKWTNTARCMPGPIYPTQYPCPNKERFIVFTAWRTVYRPSRGIALAVAIRSRMIDDTFPIRLTRTRTKGNWSYGLLFDPRDLWFGVYWKTYMEAGSMCYAFYITIIPTLPVLATYYTKPSWL